ncbi:Uu.00g071940.m01.CDS01 [Anthostomella pinea]|uniref:Uu.00g071940.m01.CDS01 n=1 Tax=Anthostomella pinea TaxID=933095 RepID=A0AAI8YNP3_9PEZI|nr:Uu.00g071940.m01.CDS01 [Anthostomella pinea]
MDTACGGIITGEANRADLQAQQAAAAGAGGGDNAACRWRRCSFPYYPNGPIEDTTNRILEHLKPLENLSLSGFVVHETLDIAVRCCWRRRRTRRKPIEERRRGLRGVSDSPVQPVPRESKQHGTIHYEAGIVIPRLPAELQCKIWEDAIEGERASNAS